jgi:DNA-binding NtrC family response regulator
VRELENVVQRALILEAGDVIEADALPLPEVAVALGNSGKRAGAGDPRRRATSADFHASGGFRDRRARHEDT